MEESAHLLAKKIQEIPPIEFSYETYYSHRKEQSSSKYNIGLLIPKSKKYIAWFTFLGEKDVCILLELNREKQIVHHKIINVVFDQKKPHLALGTFLYGSLFTTDESSYDRRSVEDRRDVGNVVETSSSETSKKGCQTYFVVEDIFMYKSVSLRKLCFGHRLAILSQILPEISLSEYEFVLPMMFDLSVYDQEKNTFPDISNVLPQVCYPIHKIQYRSFTEIIPYMNYDLYLFTSKQPKQEKMDVVLEPPNLLLQSELTGTSYPVNRPPLFSGRVTGDVNARRSLFVEKERDVFMVSADIQSDIYYLNHVHGKYRPDVAYIPNYKTSVFMNSLFRTIKENANLDTMEESDDEEEFQDIRMEKYVNLEKCIPMECMYHRKFKRWIPIRLI